MKICVSPIDMNQVHKLHFQAWIDKYPQTTSVGETQHEALANLILNNKEYFGIDKIENFTNNHFRSEFDADESFFIEKIS